MRGKGIFCGFRIAFGLGIEKSHDCPMWNVQKYISHYQDSLYVALPLDKEKVCLDVELKYGSTGI
jgi:hypothetical protein